MKKNGITQPARSNGVPVRPASKEELLLLPLGEWNPEGSF